MRRLFQGTSIKVGRQEGILHRLAEILHGPEGGQYRAPAMPRGLPVRTTCRQGDAETAARSTVRRSSSAVAAVAAAQQLSAPLLVRDVARLLALLPVPSAAAAAAAAAVAARAWVCLNIFEETRLMSRMKKDRRSSASTSAEPERSLFPARMLVRVQKRARFHTVLVLNSEEL